MWEAPLPDRQSIVKVSVVWTLGLAVLFGSLAVSLAVQRHAGGIYCDGPPDHLPPGKMCPKDFAETNLNRQDGTCEVHCCRNTPDGQLDCSADPVSAVGTDPRRNVLPRVLRGGEKAPVAPLPLPPPVAK